MLLKAAAACAVVFALSSILFLMYVIQQRLLHPLAQYPGPFWASITDLWQVYQFLTLRQPYNLTRLHEEYGPIVRYGPDKISITHEDAVSAIYPTASKSLPKTEFYDAFGGTHPNVFGTRDEFHHSVRRRHMSHAFSMSSMKDMEQYIDDNLSILKGRITKECHQNTVFDLKEMIHDYIIDVLGELAFSRSFGLQTSGDRSRAPPVKEHTLLGSVLGSWPSMAKLLKKILPLLPIASIKNLFEGRRKCAALAATCVQSRLAQVEQEDRSGVSNEKPRKDLLTTLIRAKDPETGHCLTQMDLETEAFGFIIAGTHTTMATTTLLFWNLLNNHKSMARCVQEIDASLPSLSSAKGVFPIASLEASLPYLRHCIKENYRINPVFTMPLARRITSPAGLTICGSHFPQGTSIAICNHALHHNPAIWGDSHDSFQPDRWNDPATASKSRLLMHFGLGGRQCIGKNMATTNIYKLVVTLLKVFEFEKVRRKVDSSKPDIQPNDRSPDLISVGVSDTVGGLWVKAKIRDHGETKIPALFGSIS